MVQNAVQMKVGYKTYKRLLAKKPRARVNSLKLSFQFGEGFRNREVKRRFQFSFQIAGAPFPLPCFLDFWSASRVAISRSTRLALSAGVNCEAAASSVSMVSDRNAIILSVQTRRTIPHEHHPIESIPPCWRRSRLSVARSLQTILLQRPALIDSNVGPRLFHQIICAPVYQFEWFSCSLVGGLVHRHGSPVRGGSQYIQASFAD